MTTLVLNILAPVLAAAMLNFAKCSDLPLFWGWSGGTMVLGKLPVPGRPTIWITVGQGPTALVVGEGGGCLDVFTLIYPFLFSISPFLGDGPIQTEILSQRAVKLKTTNQPTNLCFVKISCELPKCPCLH